MNSLEVGGKENLFKKTHIKISVTVGKDMDSQLLELRLKRPLMNLTKIDSLSKIQQNF